MSDARVTLSGKPADPNYNGGAPQPIDPATGMHGDYWVLSEEERSKGFVRPVRNKYIHVGTTGPTHPLRDLNAREHELYDSEGFVKYEEYPKGETSSLGRFWTQADLDKVGKGCGVVTRMGDALSETYARSPGFYGATYCVGCKTHLPVGRDGEFVWDGTDEKVGT